MRNHHDKQLWHVRLGLAASLAAVTLLGACAASDQDLDAANAGSEDIELASHDDVLDVWTDYTTDGATPIECPADSAMNGFGARGKYSDDVRIRCRSILSPYTDVIRPSWWTGYVSEDTMQTGVNCGRGAYITGMSCTGKYCDNVSVRCTQERKISVAKQVFCERVGPFSEEQMDNYFKSGWYAQAVYCTGKYCDNMEFDHICLDKKYLNDCDLMRV